MIEFDTDDVLLDRRTRGLPDAVWEAARDICEENVHENLVRFTVPERAEDFGGAHQHHAGRWLSVERRLLPCGPRVWVVTLSVGNFATDVLLLPDPADWLPAALRNALTAKARGKEVDDD